MIFRIILIITFIFSNLSVSLAQIKPYQLPLPNKLLELSKPLNPIMLQGLKIDPTQPFRFDFILQKGGAETSQLQEEGMRQASYFLAALTFSSKDLWVNLSPYEKDRLIPADVSQTILGRDLLIQDYTLKQLASSLTYPESTLGKKFWHQIYKKVKEETGNTDINVSTFNKVWIVPDKAEVYVDGNTVLVTESHLKVMIEADYIALKKQTGVVDKTPSAQMMKEIIIPVIEQEVNQGTYFANLRQITNAAILAEWYKRHLKTSLVSKAYVNKRKVNGINEIDAKTREEIYQQYLKAYKKGVYNFIRDEQSPDGSSTIPRKYFSGGMNIDVTFLSEHHNVAKIPTNLGKEDFYLLGVGVNDAAMITSSMMSSQGRGDTPKAVIERLENPFWTHTRNRLETLRPLMQQVDSKLIDELTTQNVSIKRGWKTVHYDNNNKETPIYHSRVANSNILGTAKGGIRWLKAKELMKDESFLKEWNYFLSLHPNKDQVKDFIAVWVTQESKALAMVMSLKAAGVDLNLGGAKGTVFIGDIVRDGESWKLIDLDFRRYADLGEEIARAHGQFLSEQGVVGIEIDSPAPDKNTTPPILEIYNDAYIRYLVEQDLLSKIFKDQRYESLILGLKVVLSNLKDNPHTFQNITKTPFLDEAVKFWKKNEGKLPVPIIGVFTGKTEAHGGIAGRNEATGEGVVAVMKEFFNLKAIDYRQLSVGIQAFGNVGRYTALAAAREGFKVTIITDAGIALVNEDGWSEFELGFIIEMLQQEAKKPESSRRNLRALWEEGIILTEGVKAILEDDIKVKESLFSMAIDVLIPAFSEGEVNEKNQTTIKASYIFEAANGPVTPAAESLMAARGITVIPDSLTNAGGVTASSYEMEQSMGILRSGPDVLDQLRNKLSLATRKTFENLKKYPQLTFRQAYDLLSLERLARGKMEKQHQPTLTNQSIEPHRKTGSDEIKIKREPFIQPDESDRAMLTPVGGIDLDTSDLTIKQQGNIMNKWVMPDIGSIKPDLIKGFVPVFIELKQINLPQLLRI